AHRAGIADAEIAHGAGAAHVVDAVAGPVAGVGVHLVHRIDAARRRAHRAGGVFAAGARAVAHAVQSTARGEIGRAFALRIGARRDWAAGAVGALAFERFGARIARPRAIGVAANAVGAMTRQALRRDIATAALREAELLGCSKRRASSDEDVAV